MYKNITACLTILSVSLRCSDIQEPYKSLNLLAPKVEGWFGNANRKNLTNLIKKEHPKLVVELGSWLGLSAISMAASLKDDAQLYAVDTWLGSKEHAINSVWAAQLPTLYQQFLSNCVYAQVHNRIIPVRMTTLEAARSLNIRPDLIYVDASHEENDVYADIMAWYPKLSDRGIMCGDDWTWSSVKNAVQRAADELHCSIKSENNFWQLVKK